MDCTIDTWKATTTSADDASTVLKVVGEGTCSRAGYKLELETADPGIYPQPELIALRLVLSAPDVGPDVVSPAKVEYEGRVDKAVNRVRIDTPDGTVNVRVEG
jgi:hypothetical protein